jgi:hypothetical protein
MRLQLQVQRTLHPPRGEEETRARSGLRRASPSTHRAVRFNKRTETALDRDDSVIVAN